ncbi:restriction endonuclease subunit S [Frigoribacterium sp. UYMn621]|uniref:restriction endonuclease subunit S n=1 Tax=Frigoribacterium sp. UYMn621 TaxID=3156343 RepID=UPI00339A47F1
MNDWPIVDLGAIVNVTDYVANGSFESLRLNVSYSDTPEFAVLVRLVDHNSGWSGPLKYVNKHSYEFLKKSSLAAGDVVVANVGANAGTVFRAPDLGMPMTLGPNSVLCRPRNSLEYDREFMYYFLSAPAGQSLVGSVISGSAQPKFNKTGLRKLPVPVPPIAQQRAIAEVLGALDDKIAANNKLINTADALCAALTRSALDSQASQSLSSIAVLTMGTSPAGTTFNEEGHGSVFYQGVRDFGVRFPRRRVWTTSPLRFAETGDCLLSVRAPVGQLNLASEKTCIGRGLASARSRDSRPKTLFHLLRDAPEIWAQYEAEGTIFGSINKMQLELIEVPTIVADRADHLEVQLAALEASIASALGEIELLMGTRDALLPQLMSGKLRVKDAEKVLEGVL